MVYQYLNYVYVRSLNMYIYMYSIQSAGAQVRPRSKTFEEYEKDTDDVWDDNEEDLSSPADLEFPQVDDGRGEGARVGNVKKPVGSNGKGIGE